MRIALLIYGSLDTVSGGYLYDRKLVEHLRAHGDEVEVISLAWSNYARHLTHNFSAALLRRLNGIRANVLLQDELNHPSLFWLNTKIKRAYPIISIVHHLRSSERHVTAALRLYRVIERRYLRTCDGFIYNSHTTRATVEQALGESRPHVVAYPAGDRLLSAQTQSRQDDGTLRLLFVGNVSARKGLHTLLSALAHVRGEWQLHIVGDTRVEPRYAARMHALAAPFADKVRWHERLSDDALKVQFAMCDALVVPSQYEGFGIVYLEAMSFGVPVIATDAGAAREIVRDDVDGFIVPAEQPLTLASAIQKLFDVGRRAALSHNARARFDDFPTWAQSAAHIREFLQHYEHR
jgi:glycosyltransferase involved in cell wall biosynthesis